MAMRQPDIDDVPPPPYSETDIYSSSGRTENNNNSNNSTSPYTPSGTEDAASRVSSHASSRSEVIYTPPLTPRTSGAGAAGPQLQRPHHRHDSLSNTSLPRSQQSAAQSEFAVAYFDSRPPPALSPREQLVHTITVRASTTPDDVPYAPTWAARDVTQQDWATFVNLLIPHHAAARNEAVINRKLQAEEEALAAAAAASGTASTSGRSTNSSSHASAQLDQIRADPETDPSAAAGVRREDAEAVVAQWNEGFFRPRGMVVRLSPVVEELRMPGAWDQSFDRVADSSPASAGPAPMPFPPMQPPPHGPPGLHPQSAPPSASRSWNFAGIRLSEDGISIGDRFVADMNGIRMGSFVADERGIRFGGSSGSSNATPRGQPQYGQPWHPGPRPMYGPPPPPGPFPPVPHIPAVPPPGPPPDHPLFPGTHGRGRGHGRHTSGRRSASSSSESSEESSSSDDSTSSIGSLPDYDDLYPAQLPLYKQRVVDWLSRPDEPVTRADVSQLRSDIRSARSAAREQARNPDAAAAAGTPALDEKALKAEIKALTQEWRKLKRQQRSLRREKRRERRAKRREEKRERREQKRESRRERRASRREGGGRGRGGGQGPVVWGAPPPFPPPGVHGPAPPVMPIPAVPIISTPPVPPNVNVHAQGSFPWGGGGPGRGGFGPGGFPGGGPPWGGGFGRGWGGGSPGAGRGERTPSDPLGGAFPGSWPAPAAERSAEPSSPAVPPSSQSLFRAVEEMERDLAQKVEELDKVCYEQREEELQNSSGRGRCGGGRPRGRGWGWGRGSGSRSDQAAQRLEEEIDAISRNVDKLKVEADAEFARELAAQDRKASGVW
ncbi:hypothetical protein CMUS01_01488 [Colletotrichum musicola]|uniref:RING finger domain-containing protein n=1 Tax=Colletotrichum musicola TaxID=2175873 RepID=A0A8H6NWT6_9PEZI|nr:hypothetical protein CMUS01_01488 [Colletotrichum musicola]